MFNKKKWRKRMKRFKEIWRRFRKNKTAMVGLVLVVILVGLAIFADVIVPYETATRNDVMNKLKPPSAEHIFGTDSLGRDIFARVVHGARYSLLVGIVTTGISVVIGLFLAAAAAYYGGKVDTIISRGVDIVTSVPPLILAMCIVAAFGATTENLFIALTIISIPAVVRVNRAALLNVVNQEYIEAARACGTSTFRILTKHILKNGMGTIIVNATMGVSGKILTAATLADVEDTQILDTYKAEIASAILVDSEGNKVGDLDIESCEVYSTSDLKKQITAEPKALPVYIFKNGITVVPCYGAGLWGPIWGYIGLEGDLKTIKAVRFGHKGETPGLGAKISDEPSFAEAFVAKTIGEGEILFEVAKPANRQTENNGVDAISGATITSQALGKTLNMWFGFYSNYFAKNAAAEEVVDVVEPVETVEE